MKNPLLKLDELISQACPIYGVTIIGTNQARIDFKPEATAAQKTAAQDVLASFDWTQKPPRPQASILTDIQNLSAQDRGKLLAAVAADFLIHNPDFAIKLGININGES